MEIKLITIEVKREEGHLSILLYPTDYYRNLNIDELTEQEKRDLFVLKLFDVKVKEIYEYLATLE
jgi:hypothetical protein